VSIWNTIRDPLLSNAHRFNQEYELERHISPLTNNRNEANSNALSGMSYFIWNENEDAQQVAAADRDEHHSFTSTTTF